MRNAIEMTGMTKRYGAARALNEVSATVPAGQVVGLLGHNGAGKSTLIKLALGLIRPTAGRIRVLDTDPGGDARDLHRRVGYLPESASFYASLTGNEVMEYLSALKGVPGENGRELLVRMGLSGAAGRRVSTYSKGMRQRLGLAQALLGSPELLLLDEPTAGLDPSATQEFFDVVRELRASGRTVVISSHLLAELEPHLDRAIILGHGQVLAQGPVSELRERAGLPVQVGARFSADMDGILRAPWLSELVVSARVRGERGLSLEVTERNKVEVVRRLAALPSLADIGVREPTLASLYESVGHVSGTEEEVDHA